MLAISTDKVAQIILYGHEMERGEAELRGLIDALSEAERHHLVALMWIGRDSFGVDELDEAIETAQAEATTPTADYLIGTPHFADHLETGLELLGISATEAEQDLI